jgi:hypothetical protein
MLTVQRQVSTISPALSVCGCFVLKCVYGGFLIRSSLSPKLIDRTCQTKILAQRSSLILGSEKPASLQDWNHFVNELLQSSRQVRWHDIEAISGIVHKPFLQLIRNLLRSSIKSTVPTRSGDRQIYLSNRQMISLCKVRWAAKMTSAVSAAKSCPSAEAPA